MSDLYDRGRIEIRNLLANARAQADAHGFSQFTIVDVDSHHYEDRRWDEIIPRIEDDAIRDWAQAMIQRSGKAAATTITTAQVGNQEVSGRILRSGRNQLQDARDLGPGSGQHDDIQRTIWAMNMMGIDYTVLFPTPMLHLSLHPSVDVEVALARAYSRWLTDVLLPQDTRIKTLIYLPFNDPVASLKMVEDFGGTPGVVGFMVTSIRYRPVHANEYAPVYAALQERGLPLAFHAAYNWHEQSMVQLNKFISAHALGFSFCNMIHLTNLIVNGIPERFPKLSLMWLESGLAWIPFLMQRLDNEYLMRTSECPLLKKLPSDYMREMYFSTQPMERTGSPAMMRESFEMMNAENTLVYSSDYPHWDFDVPSVIYDLPFLSDQAKRKILGGNACRLFKLPLDKRAPASAREAGLVSPPSGEVVPVASTLF